MKAADAKRAAFLLGVIEGAQNARAGLTDLKAPSRWPKITVTLEPTTEDESAIGEVRLFLMPREYAFAALSFVIGRATDELAELGIDQ